MYSRLLNTVHSMEQFILKGAVDLHTYSNPTGTGTVKAPRHRERSYRNPNGIEPIEDVYGWALCVRHGICVANRAIGEDDERLRFSMRLPKRLS